MYSSPTASKLARKAYKWEMLLRGKRHSSDKSKSKLKSKLKPKSNSKSKSQSKSKSKHRKLE